jgi:CheY-like chemotaxis protein
MDGRFRRADRRAPREVRGRDTLTVRCPHCKSIIRLRDVDPKARLVRYLCNNCQDIVDIDLERDEVRSSSSADSFERTEHGKTVLIAEDTVTVRKLAAHLLAGAGYHVLEAEDGRKALELAQSERVDLIVLDLLMPKMTGFDVLRELKKIDRVKDTPILIMSSVFKKDVLDFLHAVGVAGFMDKEQIRDALLFRVRQILAA